MSALRHHWLRWTFLCVVGGLVAVIVGVSLFVHPSTAPALITLPKQAGPETSSGAATVDGVWNAGPGSIVGWRAQQVLIGQQSTLIGRTGKVWGSIRIASGSVSQGSFTVDMAAMTSSLSQSTKRSVFDVSAYPTAALVLTSPIELGTIPADGTVEHYQAAGNLTLHGTTRAVTFTLSADRVGSDIDLLADITFPFADWNISVPGAPFLADIQSPATVEVLLHLTQGAGNTPSAQSSASSSSGSLATPPSI